MQTEATFNSCAPFTKYITNIGGSTINDAEDLDLVMLMFDFLKYSSNYSGTTGSHSKVGATYFNNNIVNKNDFKSVMYEAELLGSTVADAANAI